MYINGRVRRDGPSLAESQFLDSRGRLSANQGSVVIGGIPEHQNIRHQSIRASEHQSIKHQSIRYHEKNHHKISLQGKQNITPEKQDGGQASEIYQRKQRHQTSRTGRPLDTRLDPHRAQTIEKHSACTSNDVSISRTSTPAVTSRNPE